MNWPKLFSEVTKWFNDVFISFMKRLFWIIFVYEMPLLPSFEIVEFDIKIEC